MRFELGSISIGKRAMKPFDTWLFHAMSDEPLQLLTPIALNTADDTVVKEIQVLKVGAFKHAVYGDFTIGPDDLKAFKENFDGNVLGIQVQANFDHGQSIAHGTKASGWIKQLTIKAEGNELWATVEWTEEAVRGIKAKEWRYSSAELRWVWKHPETGKEHKKVLTGLALTNQPFIKGMQPIAASEHKNQTERTKPMELNEIIATLLTKHGINFSELQAKAGQVVTLTSQLGEANASVVKLTTENGLLTAKVEKIEKEVGEAKFSALVERAVKEGRVTKAFADKNLRAIFDKQGIELAESIVNDLPENGAVKATTTVGSGGAAGGAMTFKSPDAEVAFKAEELRKKNDKLSLSDAIAQVFAEDPKLAKRYDAWEPRGTDED